MSYFRFNILNKEEYQHSEPIHISRPMIISLVLSTIALTLPMGMLTQKGTGLSGSGLS